jgi:hypothetical protein
VRKGGRGESPEPRSGRGLGATSLREHPAADRPVIPPKQGGGWSINAALQPVRLQDLVGLIKLPDGMDSVTYIRQLRDQSE